MNTFEDLVWQQRRNEEQATTSMDELRRSRLGDLRIKTLVKEHHNEAIAGLDLATICGWPGLLASIAGHQLIIYDNNKFGCFLQVCAEYEHIESDGNYANLNALTWLPDVSSGEDAHIALGSDAGTVAVLSLSQKKCLNSVKAHRAPVTAISATRTREHELCSCSQGEDKCVVIDRHSGNIIASVLLAGVTTICLVPNALPAAVGTSSGQFKLWFPFEGASEQSDNLTWEIDTSSNTQAKIVSMRSVEDEAQTRSRIVLLKADGEIAVFACQRPSSGISEWNVDLSFKFQSCQMPRGNCGMSLSIDGKCVAVGGGEGCMSIHSLHDDDCGSELARLSPLRAALPVTACALADDGRFAASACRGGVFARYEQVELPSAPEREMLQTKGLALSTC